MQQMHFSRKYFDFLEPKDLSVMGGAVTSAVERLELEGVEADKQAIAKMEEKLKIALSETGAGSSAA